MKKLYYDLDEEKYLTERDIRKLSLKEETDDIINNINNYLDGTLSIESQTDLIKNCVYGDISNLVQGLNDSWGYNIATQEDSIESLATCIIGSDNLDYIDNLLRKIRDLKVKEIKGE
jgi:hypothetical protein